MPALKRSNMNKSKQKTRVIFTSGIQCSDCSIGIDLTERPKIAGGPAISPSEDSRRQGNNDDNAKGLKDKKSDLYKTEICRNWQEIGYCR